MALLHQDGASLQGARQGQTHLREVHPGEGTMDTTVIYHDVSRLLHHIMEAPFHEVVIPTVHVHVCISSSVQRTPALTKQGFHTGFFAAGGDFFWG